MNPEMMMYLMQQPQASHTLPSEETTSSPFNPAALAAMRAAKQSLGMDEEEQRRAMGLAIMRMFSGMGKPGYGEGFGGALSAATDNIAPAVEAYQGEQNRVANMNASLLGHIESAQLRRDMLQQRMAEKKQMEAHREAQRIETERYHRAQEAKNDRLLDLKALSMSSKMSKQQEAADKERRIEEAINRGETPFEVLEPSARVEYQKKAQKAIHDVRTNQQAIKTIEKMKKIFAKNSDIGNSWVQTLNQDSKSSSLWTILGRKFADPKKLAAAEQLNKYGSDLNLSVIYNVSPKTGTDLLKNMINQSNPSGKLTAEAFNKIADQVAARAHQNINLAKKYQDSLRRRVMVSVEDIEDTDSEKQPSDQHSSPYESISTEELLQRYQQMTQTP